MVPKPTSMKSSSNWLLLFFILLTSCATDYKCIPPGMFNQHINFQTKSEDSLKVFFCQNILESSGNKHLIRWAERHNYSVIGIKVINNSGKFRKGFQLQYYIENKRLIPVSNIWFAKKARQKMSAAPFIAIPFIILEEAIFPKSDYPKDENGFDLYPELNKSITSSVVESDSKKRKQANALFLADLKKLDLSYKILPSGFPVYGIVIFEHNVPLLDLKIRIK